MRIPAEATLRAQAAEAERGRVSRSREHPIVQLQRAAGNRAVAGLLQRQPVATAELLSSGQAARAVSFYRGQPDLYPEDVILKIQQAVGSPETGVPDAVMAQAVARWQEQNVLKIDGMAGPRTLPRMFQSGLATDESRAEFVETGKQVAEDWQALGTAEARADALFEGVKPLLDDEGVFTPEHGVGDLHGPAGVFEHRPWTITFDRVALSAASISDEDARSVASTVYHEARHAEQFHKMARMLATKGKSADEIRETMKIPIEVAQDAFDNPLPKGVEYATAAQQFDSVYGAGKARHDKAEDEAPTLGELNAARDAAQANPTPANKARYALVLSAYKAYHDLPTEHDAFATEIDFGSSWDEASVAQ